MGMETGSNQNSLLIPSQLSYSFAPAPSAYLPQMRTTIPSLSSIPSLEVQIPDIPVETSLPQQPISFVSTPSVEPSRRHTYPVPPQPPSLKPQDSYVAMNSTPSVNSPPVYGMHSPHMFTVHSPPSVNSPPMFAVPHSPPPINSPPMYSVPIPHSPLSEHLSTEPQSFSSSYVVPSSSIGISVPSSSFVSDSPSSPDSVVVIGLCESRDELAVLIERRRKY